MKKLCFMCIVFYITQMILIIFKIFINISWWIVLLPTLLVVFSLIIVSILLLIIDFINPFKQK